MGKLLRRIAAGVGIAAAALVLLIGGVVAIAGLTYRDPAHTLTPSGLPREQSIYLTMRDGTRIAADVWLPLNLKSGQRVPVLVKGTPYWRAGGLTLLGKALTHLGMTILASEPDMPILNGRGYAVIAADTRGTGASFGRQRIALDDPEVEDFGQLIDWAARQPWSNGRVGAYGFSYRGMLAVNMASLVRPAMKAIAPSFDFTDLYLATFPGGVFSDTFLRKWGAQTGELNRGDPPCLGLCRWLISGPRPVDADRDGSLLRAAVAEHAGDYDVYACAKRAPDRDNRICDSDKTISDVSEFTRSPGVERARVPMYVIAGWFDDDSPAQVLRRFSTWSNPQQVVIGAISHGGFRNTDPFAPPRVPVDPSYARQTEDMADFFDRYLKADEPPAPSSVRYEVLNGRGWRSSSTWPPTGVVPARLYLARGGLLSPQLPATPGRDAYAVDFRAGSGPLSRYQSPVDLSKTSYPDRAQADRKLLTYTSAPLASDLLIAGDPEADLTVASSAPDGIVIVYLEDMLPNGRVLYLTEGLLRLADRKLAPDARGGDQLHSYLARDAAPMPSGQAVPIRIALSPIAVLVHKGERLRIALAGADSDNLERIPASGPQTLTFERSPGARSFLNLPTLAAR